MGDPCVVYLRYRLVPTNDSTEFRAPSLDRETDEFVLHVGPQGEGVPGPFAAVSARPANDDGGELDVRPDVEAVFTFKAHHRSEQSAHAAVQPLLEAWQLEEALRQPGRPPRFRIEIAGSLVVDRAPPPGQEATYSLTGGGSLYVRPADETAVVEEFPEPPTQFFVDKHAKTLWQRWERYVNGEDTLPAAAYACLTYVQTEFGPGEREAATRLGVTRGLLRKIRELSSRTGDDATARKFAGQPRRAHTPEEIGFLENAITALIGRVAHIAATGDASRLHELNLNNLASPAAMRRG